MKRSIIFVAAALVAATGCRSEETPREAGEDVAEATREMQEDVREERQETAETAREGAREVGEEREDLREARIEEMERQGQPVTIVGIVSDASEDSLTLDSPQAGEKELKLDESASPSWRNVQEGSQARATYRMQDDERVVQSLEVLAPPQQEQPRQEQPQPQP